mgnify:CR=1 FL=1
MEAHPQIQGINGSIHPHLHAIAKDCRLGGKQDIPIKIPFPPYLKP